MTRIIILTFLTFFTVFKLTAQKDFLAKLPKVDFTISLLKDTFNISDDILIKMVITNNAKKAQMVLFDKPKLSTGGLLETSVSLKDINTGKSVLKYANKNVLSSQGYSDKQLQDKYYKLATGQSLKGQYSLFDLAVTNLDNYGLEKGTYELQVSYYNNQSNTLTFTIR